LIQDNGFGTGPHPERPQEMTRTVDVEQDGMTSLPSLHATFETQYFCFEVRMCTADVVQ